MADWRMVAAACVVMYALISLIITAVLVQIRDELRKLNERERGR